MLTPIEEPKPVIIKETKPNLYVIEKNLCKVYYKEREVGRGFFSMIQFFSLDIIPILIISNDLSEDVDMLTGDEIIISLKNNNNISIILDDSRTIYKEKEYGITIIEIKKADGLDINSFLEIDNDIYLDKSEYIYKNNKIYLSNYPDKNVIKFYDGKINRINLDNHEIDYSNINEEVFIGSPIIKGDNSKIIGIHTGRKKKIGLFIKYIILEFYNMNIFKIKKIYETNEKSKTITAMYRIDGNNKIKIFDKDFINNNKQCKIIIDGKEQEICEYVDVDKLHYDPKINKCLTIKLKNLDGIIDYYCMFYNCETLYSLPDISELNTKNVKSFRSMFNGCKSLEWLPDELNWDTSNVTDISLMFKECISLKKLPDISKWNTNNIDNMSGVFEECRSLRSLPDI